MKHIKPVLWTTSGKLSLSALPDKKQEPRQLDWGLLATVLLCSTHSPGCWCLGPRQQDTLDPFTVLPLCYPHCIRDRWPLRGSFDVTFGCLGSGGEVVAASLSGRRGWLGNNHLTVGKQNLTLEKLGALVRMQAGAVMQSGLQKCVWLGEKPVGSKLSLSPCS